MAKKKEEDTRQLSWDSPLFLNGNYYPTTMFPVEDTSGNIADTTVFADANGMYHSLDSNGNVQPVILQHTLPEVIVKPSKEDKDALLQSALNRYLTLDKDKTRVSKIPYDPNHIEETPQDFFTMELPSGVKDNLFTRALYSIKPEKQSTNFYKNSLSPYNYEDDIDPNGKIFQGPFTTGNEKASRLGSLGLVKVGNNKYRLYDENGNIIKQCAKTRNELEKMLGHPTTNNAWDTFGIYGDSTLFSGYLPKVGPYTLPSYVIQNQIAADRTQSAIENIDLQTGDVVDLYSPFSHYAKRAYNEGTLNRSNSHTGMIFQPYPNLRKKTYVIHNISGNISVDPIGNFLINENNWLPKWRITGFHRPGTKEHPYLRNGKPAHL